jgi:hypothetical protein
LFEMQKCFFVCIEVRIFTTCSEHVSEEDQIRVVASRSVSTDNRELDAASEAAGYAASRAAGAKRPAK